MTILLYRTVEQLEARLVPSQEAAGSIPAGAIYWARECPEKIITGGKNERHCDNSERGGLGDYS